MIGGQARQALRRARGMLRCVLSGLLLTAYLASAFALDPERHLAEEQHRLFSPRLPTPTDVTSAAQTDDGFLWVGTSVGLFRFDGIAFEPVTSMDNQSIVHQPVITLVAVPGNGLWIGYGAGTGVGYYKDGKYIRFKPEEGWDNLFAGAVDRDGVIWAVMASRLVRIDGQEKHVADFTWGMSDDTARDVVVDKFGTVWVTTTGQRDLMYLPRGERQFKWVGQHVGAGLLAAAPDGTVFVSGSSGLRAVVTHEGRPQKVLVVSNHPFGRALVDRDGGMLISTPTGLAHIGDAHRLMERNGGAELLNDSLPLVQGTGPAVAAVWAIIEDSQANVWVCSTNGLERFRDSKMVPLRVATTSFPLHIVRGDNGVMWAASWDSGLLKIEGHEKVTAVNSTARHISSLYRDPNGAIWLATPNGLWRSEGGQPFARVPIPNELLQPWVSAMNTDGAGNLWVLAGGIAMGSPVTGEWRELPSGGGLGVRSLSHSIAVDNAGQVWLSLQRSIIRYEAGRPRPLAALSSAVHVGAILTLSIHGEHVWVGGVEGVAVALGDHVMNLKVRDGPGFNQVTAILETFDGELWVRGGDDAWRVSAAELRQAIREDRETVEAEHFDSRDGLDRTELLGFGSLMQAPDGLVWFGTDQGLAWFDPKHQRPSALPPVRRIKTVEVDGQLQTDTHSITLPPLAHRLEIAYTAIEFTFPERIQFRYRLEGIDKDWQNVGDRRVAYYDNLPPGDYRFRFASTDHDGHWLSEPEPLSVHVTAAWFQTLWFKILALIVVLSVVTFLYLVRVRRIAARLRDQLVQQFAERNRITTIRQAERDRIARELHDTLLQGTQGLTLKFYSLAAKLPANDQVRVAMEKTLLGANQLLRECRDSVEGLRSDRVQGELSQALIIAARHFELDGAPAVSVTLDGESQQLHEEAWAECYRIAREALSNAFRHAQASNIWLRIDYAEQELAVEVRDDGLGFDVAQAKAAHVAGHWGLPGMKERAETVGASISVISTPGAGTTVLLKVPADRAYQSPASFRAWTGSPQPEVGE